MVEDAVQRGKDLWIHQEKFIDELEKRYSHLQPFLYTPDFKAVPEEETAGDVRSAQKIIGELTWIGSRLRILLCQVYSVVVARYCGGPASG